MIFRTELAAVKSDFSLTHQSTVMTIGSCFAENIGERLLYHGFDVLINPFGIVYNPMSIAKQLDCVLQPDFYFDESHIFYHNELYHSFLHHSIFSHSDKKTVLNRLNESLHQARLYLAKADCLLLTFGTAQVHETVSQKMIVANCHKLPASHFNTYRLDTETVVTVVEQCLQKLTTLRPELQIILTVSPVRYLREGLIQSNRSKATLLLATEKLTTSDNNRKNRQYFSAYEYLLDDLRDYRFFSDDLLHPNEQAVTYIWEKFAATYFEQTTLDLCLRVGKARKMRAHRPFNTDTTAFQNFQNKTETEWQNLQKILPHL